MGHSKKGRPGGPKAHLQQRDDARIALGGQYLVWDGLQDEFDHFDGTDAGEGFLVPSVVAEALRDDGKQQRDAARRRRVRVRGVGVREREQGGVEAGFFAVGRRRAAPVEELLAPPRSLAACDARREHAGGVVALEEELGEHGQEHVDAAEGFQHVAGAVHRPRERERPHDRVATAVDVQRVAVRAAGWVKHRREFLLHGGGFSVGRRDRLQQVGRGGNAGRGRAVARTAVAPRVAVFRPFAGVQAGHRLHDGWRQGLCEKVHGAQLPVEVAAADKRRRADVCGAREADGVLEDEVVVDVYGEFILGKEKKRGMSQEGAGMSRKEAGRDD